MEDYRLHYALSTIGPEQAKELPREIKKKIAGNPTPSVRPNIPEGLEYVGTDPRENDLYFDYYLCPDGSLRQEGRRKHQDIIISYNPEGRRHGKDKKAHYLLPNSGTRAVGTLERSQCESAQSDGRAVWEMESNTACTGCNREVTGGIATAEKGIRKSVL